MDVFVYQSQSRVFYSGIPGFLTSTSSENRDASTPTYAESPSSLVKNIDMSAKAYKLKDIQALSQVYTRVLSACMPLNKGSKKNPTLLTYLGNGRELHAQLPYLLYSTTLLTQVGRYLDPWRNLWMIEFENVLDLEYKSLK